MALTIQDGTGASKTLKTTLDGSDLIPHHLIGSDTMVTFRSLTGSTTAGNVKSSGGSIYGWIITNRHTSDIYVKFYNKLAASVNPASDVPIFTPILVPASGQVVLEPGCIFHTCSTAISIRAVTGSGDTDATSPGTSPDLTIKYI